MKNIRRHIPIKIDFYEFLNDFRIEVDRIKSFDDYPIDKSIWLLLDKLEFIFPKDETEIKSDGIIKLLELYPYKYAKDTTIATVVSKLLPKSKLFWKLIYELQYKQAPLKECSICRQYWFNRNSGGCNLNSSKTINPAGSVVRKNDRCIDFEK